MTATKASKKTSSDIKSKPKRKMVEDTTEKKVSFQSVPNKKARKDDAQSPKSFSEISSKPTAVTSKAAHAAHSNESPKHISAAASTKPSKISQKSSKSGGSKEKNAELYEESDLSDEESGLIEVKGGEGDEDNENEDYHLIGFSSEEDSSDEEVDQNAASLDVSKLPPLAKEDVALQKRLDDAKKNQSEERGVIYLGRIPHGFYEDEMRAYFSQFGDVTRLRLSRNKKTGHSKHYAFIEFSSAEVAQIVSETMNNYLLMGHILQCRVLSKDQIHPELWVGANRKWRHVPHDRIVRVSHNKIRSPEERARAEKTLLSRQRKKQKKIQESGIDYDIEPVSYKRPVETSA